MTKHRDKLRSCSTALWLLLSMAGVVSCGIKPSDVDPPPGAERAAWPATYPNPATDPR